MNVHGRYYVNDRDTVAGLPDSVYPFDNGENDALFTLLRFANLNR
jgi:hypothetical protein